MSDASFTRRREDRTPANVFVNLYSPETHTFEVVVTTDISPHGARVVTKQFWRPNLPLSVRAVQGDLYSHGRVVHCERKGNVFVVGLEMYHPEGKWEAANKIGSDP